MTKHWSPNSVSFKYPRFTDLFFRLVAVVMSPFLLLYSWFLKYPINSALHLIYKVKIRLFVDLLCQL